MVFASLIALAVVAVGLVVVRNGIKKQRHANASLQWPTAQGRIESQSFDEVTERDAEGDLVTTYYVRPQYAYEHAGQTYRGDRIHHGGHATGSRKRAGQWREAYAADRPVTVYVNPEDPAYAVLEPKGEGGHLVSVVVGGFLAFVGLAMLLAML